MVDLQLLAPERLRPLSRAEYDRMVEMGLFGPDERVELLEGVLVSMSPQRPPHADCIRRFTQALVQLLQDRAQVRVQLPLAIGAASEPEPDVAVVPSGDYSREHPAEALLVVEVADTTLRKDRLIKGPAYAAAGVPEYWIANLQDRRIEVHRDPVPAGEANRPATGYRHVEHIGPGGAIRPLRFPELQIPVDALLR